MTIAAQHIRAALNHLRLSDRRWRDVVRAVGPFDLRLDRQPVVWLVRNLECRTFHDHAEVAEVSLAPSLRLTSESLMTAQQPAFQAWGGTLNQWRFLQELKVRLASGQLDLGQPTSPPSFARQAEALEQFLISFDSQVLPRFLFYCWGDLDTWPSADGSLADALLQLWSGEAKDTLATAGLLSERLELVGQRTDSWRPYRAVAAWYLERYALMTRERRPGLV